MRHNYVAPENFPDLVQPKDVGERKIQNFAVHLAHLQEHGILLANKQKICQKASPGVSIPSGAF